MSPRIPPLAESLLSFVILFLLGAYLSAQTVTEFPLPRDSNPDQIVVGPDGALWFTEYVYDPVAEIRSAPAIGRMTTAGSFSEFSLSSSFGAPIGIASGPDGNLWFTQVEATAFDVIGWIGRITTGGVITEFPPLRGVSFDITAGPDGNLWFPEQALGGLGGWIGRITTGGAITEFLLTGGGYPIMITVGRDGNLWFTKFPAKIGRITTSGVITEFPLSTTPQGITAGPDGNIWFTETDKIGRITSSGVITEFSIPTPSSDPGKITVGPDGNLWFTEAAASQIGRITPDGVITEFPLPTPHSRPVGITAGPDRYIWFTEFDGKKIGRLTVPPIASRILPVVGSTPGVGGSFFKTAVQLHNPTSSAISGRIVFHPSGLSGSGSDPALSYNLSGGQTQSIADLLPAMGRSGLGSADIELTSGTVPVVTARVFNDAGAAGTTGFTEELMRTEEALHAGQSGVLLLPADLTTFRFNIGVRTLEAGATATLTLRDPSGAVVATVSRAFPATYHEQQSALAFLSVTTLPGGGSVTMGVTSGAAIIYGATVDNRTGDPSLQIARAAP